MHMQIVNFNLQGMSHEEFQTLCDQLAPTFANIPGLISKIWLADPSSNTYGGIYTWQNPQALEAYTHTEIFHNVVNHPNFTNLVSREYGILEGPTQVTHGLARAATN
jgi:quinol monooxygenase YgiN